MYEVVTDALFTILWELNALPLHPQRDVFDVILLRMSRHVAAADAYQKLKRILRTSDLSFVRAEDTHTTNTNTMSNSSSKAKELREKQAFHPPNRALLRVEDHRRHQFHIPHNYWQKRAGIPHEKSTFETHLRLGF